MQYNVKIITSNACLSLCPPLRFNGAFSRSDRFVDALYSHIDYETDVICLQELIVNRSKIIKQFIHHPFSTDIVSPDYIGNNIRFVHSGLAIVSKWPILLQKAHIFTGPTYHAEAFMAKSVLYAKLKHPFTHLHVFVTHAQAWSNQKAKKIRLLQFEQIYRFIQRCTISPSEPVFLCGDFNNDFYEHSRILQDMMDIVHCKMHLPLVPQFSFDPTLNSLVGTDDASEYATHSFLKGCYDEFLQTGICSCCPKQLIDGIATSIDHLQPKKCEVEVIYNTSNSPFEIYINVSTKRTIQHVSDHFAVQGSFMFEVPDVIIEGAFYKTDDLDIDYYYWVGLELVVACCIFYLMYKLFRI